MLAGVTMAAKVVTRPTTASATKFSSSGPESNQASLADFHLIFSTRRVPEAAFILLCH
jgi:hypothetical protein